METRGTAATIWHRGPRFLESDNLIARYVGRPVADYLRVETAGSVLLFVSAAIALVWANSPWGRSYTAFWQTPMSLSIGDWSLQGDLHHWVNDGLMTIFFFVVGLEIKYELVEGHLRDIRTAITPVLAAAGGMLVPALIYLAITHGTSDTSGWGIPMATDIAFAVGVLGLLGNRVPAPARVFLLTLAIADDIGAILVIAVFYAAQLKWLWLLVLFAILAVIMALVRLRVWSIPVYLVLGVAAWFATYQSGIHATIAGVALGLLTPATPLVHEREARRLLSQSVSDRKLSMDELIKLKFLLVESVPVSVRLQAKLHPISSYLVLPIFAIANAGIAVHGDVLTSALTSHVTIGVALGLLLGKVTGICAATWLSVKLAIGKLPGGTTWPVLVGVGLVAGVGFTVALLVAGLSFAGGSPQLDDAKLGVLLGSLVSATAGILVLRWATYAGVQTRARPERGTTRLYEAVAPKEPELGP